jgi:hypothetical protein
VQRGRGAVTRYGISSTPVDRRRGRRFSVGKGRHQVHRSIEALQATVADVVFHHGDWHSFIHQLPSRGNAMLGRRDPQNRLPLSHMHAMTIATASRPEHGGFGHQTRHSSQRRGAGNGVPRCVDKAMICRHL